MIDHNAKQEAFAEWDRYRERFAKTIEGITHIRPDENTILKNPLVMIVFADGYLRGKAIAQDKARADAQVMFDRLTAMRVQIQDWIDAGVSRPDMEAYLKSEGDK